MTKLFEETKIKNMVLKNRLVRSATWEGMCDDSGRPTEKLINCYRNLAKGGVGLIISGYTYVREDGKQMPGKMGIYTDDFASEMKSLTDAVHEAGGKVCIQIVHAGGQTNSKYAGRQPLAPSAVEVEQFSEVPQEMTAQDIREVIAAFGNAASRAKDSGFDAVQFHGAHGYLINQFLSPLTNRRTDDYGGSIENRCRFLMEIYHAVREAVGDDFPVMIKLNGADFVEGWLSTEDAVYAAKTLDKAGIDVIEVSGGTPASGKQSPVRTGIKTEDQEVYNRALGKAIKDAVKCPVMLVGGIRSFHIAEKLLGNGTADYISLSRPFIREPDLANRWQSGNHSRATCISCNACFKPGLKGLGIYCVAKEKEEVNEQKQ
jgi:2,4-dienoyl-CoA reductase-like NADH-dependent reductase (Old Yellow Enzyme family)